MKSRPRAVREPVSAPREQGVHKVPKANEGGAHDGQHDANADLATLARKPITIYAGQHRQEDADATRQPGADVDEGPKAAEPSDITHAGHRARRMAADSNIVDRHQRHQ